MNMSKLIATLVATLFAATAFAQTGVPGQPPTQAPAGNAVTDKRDAKAADAAATTPTTDKKAARAAKAKARHAKRDAKVGDKPLN
jgi:hypothetical protein